MASCHTTLDADPHIKKRFAVDEETGFSQSITRTVPRPFVIKHYFEGACQIDVHNHMRQGVMSIEEQIGTNDHIFRLFCSIFGMCTVDAFKFYNMGNSEPKIKAFKPFIEAAAVALLTNRRRGCPELAGEQRQLRKRAVEEIDEEDSSNVHQVSCVCFVVHSHAPTCLISSEPEQGLQKCHVFSVFCCGISNFSGDFSLPVGSFLLDYADHVRSRLQVQFSSKKV